MLVLISKNKEESFISEELVKADKEPTSKFMDE